MPFTFNVTVPGIANPFSSAYRAPSDGPVQPAIDTDTRLRPCPTTSRHPSPSLPTSKKRGWVPATAEPSRPATADTHSAGYLDTPAKYRDMLSDDQDDMVADLPPAKRRRGIAGSIISTAFSAALIGTAVGLTVYRLWRDRGKEPTPEHIEAPPPYQELPDNNNTQSFLSPPTPRTPRRPRQTYRRGAGSTPKTSTLHRRTHSRPHASPTVVPPHFNFAPSTVDEVDVEDHMDWMGDKLAQLIEEGKRALGREVVVASERQEDEVDDGSGEWEELDYGSPGAGPSSWGSASLSRRGGRARGRRPTPLQSSSRAHSISTHPSPRFPQPDGVGLGFSTPSPSQNWDIPRDNTGMSASFREDASAWQSPEIRASMESARAAYLANRAARGS